MSGLNIVGVQFRRAGKIYDFDANGLSLAVGDKVVVDTERGMSLAEVKRIAYIDEEAIDRSTLKSILRLASQKDLSTTGRLTKEYAESFTREKIEELNLGMNIINVEVQFGGNKVIVFFSAPGRVDFRELVKELAGGLKSRVELRQIGARDEAKEVGGIGICGREFCCSSFLREFMPVSIKMAKNQNLALNPNKVSGVCGRLLCCLTYEDEIYSHLRGMLLPKKTKVKLKDGSIGVVLKGEVLSQKITVETLSGEIRQALLSDLEVIAKNSVKVDMDDFSAELDDDKNLDENSSRSDEDIDSNHYGLGIRGHEDLKILEDMEKEDSKDQYLESNEKQSNNRSRQNNRSYKSNRPKKGQRDKRRDNKNRETRRDQNNYSSDSSRHNSNSNRGQKDNSNRGQKDNSNRGQKDNSNRGQKDNSNRGQKDKRGDSKTGNSRRGRNNRFKRNRNNNE